MVEHTCRGYARRRLRNGPVIQKQTIAKTPKFDEESTTSVSQQKKDFEKLQKHFITNDAFIDECIAEGNFVVTCMIMQHYFEIIEKYPDRESRFRHYRMAVKFGLCHYWERWKMHSSLNSYDFDLCAQLHVIDDVAVRLDVLQTEIEKLVVEYYCNGLTLEEVAIKIDLTAERVRLILTRVARRLGVTSGAQLFKEQRMGAIARPFRR